MPPFLQSHYVLGPRMLWHKGSARPPIHFSVMGSETLTGGRHVSTIPSTYVYIYIYMYRNVNAYYSAAADTGCFCCVVSCCGLCVLPISGEILPLILYPAVKLRPRRIFIPLSANLPRPIHELSLDELEDDTTFRLVTRPASMTNLGRHRLQKEESRDANGSSFTAVEL